MPRYLLAEFTVTIIHQINVTLITSPTSIFLRSFNLEVLRFGDVDILNLQQRHNPLSSIPSFLKKISHVLQRLKPCKYAPTPCADSLPSISALYFLHLS